MNLEMIKTLLLFAGGLGMFLYGMELMGEGLQKAAGDKTRRLLESLTKNPLMGLLAGALVTAIIQSSSATTVMVVGFVNASLMSLTQACTVIMGANIGTTMTGWIVSMGEWASFLKPEMIAPILLMSGVILSMTVKSSRLKDGSKILIGFGILFLGLSSMSGSITPYADSPVFTKVFEVLGSNPLLGVLAGVGVTAIIQSSSASMGILQTMAMAGAVNWGSAVFIALGQNIGTCVTALLSSLSGDTNAKRAAMIHLEFNVIGALIVGAAAVVFFMFQPSLMMAGVSSSSLALFHTGFNVAVTAILFPFRKQLVELSKILINPAKHQKKHSAALLDPRLQSIPNAAIQALFAQLDVLKGKCLSLIDLSREVLIDSKDNGKLHEKGAKILADCIKVKEYCSGVDLQTLNESEQKQLQRILLSARDLHQIAMNCIAIGTMKEDSLGDHALSESMKEDINTLSTLCKEALFRLQIGQEKSMQTSPEAKEAILRVQQEVVSIQSNIEERRRAHFQRAQKNKEHAETSWLFFDAAECYEQIALRTLRLADEDAWQNTLHRQPELETSTGSAGLVSSASPAPCPLVRIER